MAFLGGTSCSTSIGQTVTFGLLSASVSSLCSLEESMCCTCTTLVQNITTDGTEDLYTTVTRPHILKVAFPWKYATHIRSFRRRSLKEETSGGCLPESSRSSNSFQRFRRQLSETRSCNCLFSKTLQAVLMLVVLVSAVNLFISCFPSESPTPQTFIIQPLPPPANPVPANPVPVFVPAITFLLPAIRSAVIPLTGASLPSDGCPRSGVLVQGICAPILESLPPCLPPQWVVLNASTFPPQGTCGTRLCGRGRVFFVSDQLCHDIREPGHCPDDKRLHITAFGSPICDCVEGHFPDEFGTCFPLFSRGPCLPGEVWSPDIRIGSFSCRPQRCPTDDALTYIPFDDGLCYPLGSRGPCAAGQLLGYSISMQRAVCTTLEEVGYSEPEDIAAVIDELYPKFTPPDFTPNVPGIFRNGLVKKQVGSIVSEPIIPDLILNISPNPGTILETPLLTQCRPGAVRDVNYKCRDVILGPNIDSTPPGVYAPPVPPLQTCPDNLCFNDVAECVSCEQALVDTCVLSTTISLEQISCDTLAAGLG